MRTRPARRSRMPMTFANATTTMTCWTSAATSSSHWPPTIAWLAVRSLTSGTPNARQPKSWSAPSACTTKAPALASSTILRRGAQMLFYPAALPLSRQTLDYTAGIIRRHRKQIGSPWRKLNPGRQALLVLAYLRKGETFAELAAGFGVGTATAWRYVTETVALLAARSPKLRRALAAAKDAGH